MSNMLPESELLEHLLVMIAALEAAHSWSERASALVEADDRPHDLAHALGGVDALLDLAVGHRDRVAQSRRAP